MNGDRFAKYEAERQKINKYYQVKKWQQRILFLSISVVLILLINQLPHLFNIAVRLVGSVMLGIIGITCIRIRVVTLERIKQEKLRYLEQSEPAFHATFK